MMSIVNSYNISRYRHSNASFRICARTYLCMYMYFLERVRIYYLAVLVQEVK